MEGLPVTKQAALFSGLGADSRTVMKMTGRTLTTTETLLAGIADRLSVLIWQNAGGKESNKPRLILKEEDAKQQKSETFSSPEEFMKRRETFLKQKGGDT